MHVPLRWTEGQFVGFLNALSMFCLEIYDAIWSFAVICCTDFVFYYTVKNDFVIWNQSFVTLTLNFSMDDVTSKSFSTILDKIIMGCQQHNIIVKKFTVLICRTLKLLINKTDAESRLRSNLWHKQSINIITAFNGLSEI